MLGAPEASRARDRRRLGSDQRQQPALQRALVQLHLVADLEAVDHVEQRLQRDALGVEEQLLRRRAALADGQDAQVSEHLALVRQERRVAALARAQVRELVGHLPVEELDRAGAAESELAPLGAVDQASALAQDAVLGAGNRSQHRASWRASAHQACASCSRLPGLVLTS